MRVGFDAKRLFSNFTGLGNYSRTLVSNLARFYPDIEIQLYSPKIVKQPRTQPFLDNPRYNVYEGGGAAWRTWSVARELAERRVDVYHGLSHEIPFSSQRTDSKMVVTVHDLIHKTRPKDYSAIDRLIYERKIKYACANADAIVAISESTRNDILKYYKPAPEKVHVIYQACHDQFSEDIQEQHTREARELFSLPEEYFLYVGSVIPRKNLHAVIAALKSVPKGQRKPLVVIGGGRSYFGKVVKDIEKHGLQNDIHFLGDVPFNLFPAIYQHALALVYPSIAEGFGIPVIEALSVGTPVITSNQSSLPEAAGMGSILINPTSTSEIKEAMMRICDPGFDRDSIIEAGKSHVRKFDPQMLTRQLVEVYQQVMAS